MMLLLELEFKHTVCMTHAAPLATSYSLCVFHLHCAYDKRNFCHVDSCIQTDTLYSLLSLTLVLKESQNRITITNAIKCNLAL